MATRNAMFAGSWYPASAGECEREIRNFLTEAPLPETVEGKTVGGIVPHAGWYYSGRIACSVVHALARNESADVVAVFGMHLPVGAPRYLMAEGSWETPFGPLPIHEALADSLRERYRFTIETPRNFSQDNTIELQLPFIRYFFGEVGLLPIGAPPDEDSLAVARDVVDLAREKDLRIKVLGSTDLTHYGSNYGFTARGTGPEAVDWVRQTNDRRMIEAMEALDAQRVVREAIENRNACCAGAVASAVAAARRLGAARARMLEYATSFDKRPADSFVGYVGMVFEG